MRSFIAVAAFAATTNAFVGRRDNCCFHLTSSGGLSGDLGQLDDGQVRIGDNSLSASSFCIDANGVITDGAGRGCIITGKYMIPPYQHHPTPPIQVNKALLNSHDTIFSPNYSVPM